MLLGAITNQTDAPPPSTALPTAYAIADFVNGTYSYNGTPVSLSSVITDELPSVVTGSGLHLIAGHNPIPFVGDFYTALFTFNWTILLELDIDANDNEHRILNVGSETPAPFGYTNEIILINFGDWEFEDKNNDYPGTPPGTGTSVSRFIDDSTNGLTNAVHKLGITRTDAHSVLSVDGFAVQELTTPVFYINAPTGGSTDVMAAIGAYRFSGETVPNSFYLRKFQIFDPLTSPELVSITAL